MMKHGKNYALAALFLCAGLIVFIIGFAMMGFNVMNFDTEPVYIQKNYTADSGVTALRFEETDADITVKPSDDGKIHIKYYENANKTYNIEKQDDGTLIVSKTVEKGFFDNFLVISVSTPFLTVELPTDYSGSLAVFSTDGDITVSDITAETLRIRSDGGNIKTNNVFCEGNIDTATDTGSLEVYETATNGTAKFKSDSGRLFVQSVSAKDIYVETVNGHMTLVDISAADTVFAESDYNGIKLSSIDIGKSLTVIADNGGISGSVVGNEWDFAYNCSASNGKNNLSELPSLGTKQLNLRAENGDIEILFINAAAPQGALS